IGRTGVVGGVRSADPRREVRQHDVERRRPEPGDESRLPDPGPDHVHARDRFHPTWVDGDHATAGPDRLGGDDRPAPRCRPQIEDAPSRLEKVEPLVEVDELERGPGTEALLLGGAVVRVASALAQEAAAHGAAEREALHEPAVGMGPSEFESESLAPQARRMVQATPRPRDVPASRRLGPFQITVCPSGRAALVDEPPDGDHRAGDDRRVQDRQPEERPQIGPSFLRPDGCLGGGAPRVGGVRVVVRVFAHARTISTGPTFLTARFVRSYAANHGSRAAGPVGLRTSRWTFAPASPGAYESLRASW